MKTTLVFIFTLFFFSFSVLADKVTLNVFDLKCENLRNPLGIDKTAPHLSWKVRSNKNGTEQKTFQILVASDLSILDKDKADLWSSGKIESSASILVPYQGKTLRIRISCLLENPGVG